MHAKQDKLSAESKKKRRLKDLPNMRLATERMLKKAGIQTVEQLQDVGASQAYNAIKQSQELDPKPELLWALEGAIRGEHWSLISHERREQLLERVSGSLSLA
jgi:DNA transformation protein